MFDYVLACKSIRCNRLRGVSFTRPCAPLQECAAYMQEFLRASVARSPARAHMAIPARLQSSSLLSFASYSLLRSPAVLTLQSWFCMWRGRRTASMNVMAYRRLPELGELAKLSQSHCNCWNQQSRTLNTAFLSEFLVAIRHLGSPRAGLGLKNAKNNQRNCFRDIVLHAPYLGFL